MKGAFISGAFAALSLSGCVSSPSCGLAETPVLLNTLYFGTATPEGVVTPEQWKDFLNEMVTPRFPRGLTWWEASGQWQTAAGMAQREASHLLQVVHSENQDNAIAFHEIINHYKTRFHQEAVLWVRTQACVPR